MGTTPAKTGGGATNPWVQFTNPWERIVKACTQIMNLWVRIKKTEGTVYKIGAHGLEFCVYSVLIRGHDLLNRGNSLRICEYSL